MNISNYNQAGFTSPNSIKFVREDDSPTKRKDISVVRKGAVFNTRLEEFSVPEYRIAIRKDVVNDGKPTGRRLSFDLTIRTPITDSTADFDEAHTELQAMLADVGFKDAVMRQLFPETTDL